MVSSCICSELTFPTNYIYREYKNIYSEGSHEFGAEKLNVKKRNITNVCNDEL